MTAPVLPPASLPSSSHQRHSTRAVWVPLALASMAAVLVTALLTVRRVPRDGQTPPARALYALPPFSLVGQDGTAVTLQTLRGRPWLAAFIFTRCRGTCPLMSARMSRLRPELPEGVRLVSFTVDPGHDTPEVLARYASALGAGERWLFLTGPQRELYRLATQGFKLPAEELPPGQEGADGPFLHSSKLVLVDAENGVRAYYDSADEEALSTLLRDARQLASTGAGR